MWIAACGRDEVEPEDVIGLELNGRDYAIVRSPRDEYFATDGHCTHERERLCDGLVQDGEIECPRHLGRFDYATGRALGAPVLVDLRTYPTKVDGDTVYLDVPE